jgi:hypothetical protein
MELASDRLGKLIGVSSGPDRVIGKVDGGEQDFKITYHLCLFESLTTDLGKGAVNGGAAIALLRP